MPDAREMSGIPRPVNDLPDGVVSVRLVRGSLSNNLVGHDVDLNVDGALQRAKTDETGRAQFRPVAPGARVQALAMVDDERLASQEFQMPPAGGVRLLLVATDKAAEAEKGARAARPPQQGTVALGNNTRFVVEIGEDELEVLYVLEILNSAAAPVEPRAPLVFELPSAAQSATVLKGSSPQGSTAGRRLTIVGPFAPGATEVQLAYRIPVTSGTKTITQAVPSRLQNLMVIVEKRGTVEIHSPQLANHQERLVSGQTFILANGPGLGEGEAFTLEIRNIPHHSRLPVWIALGVALAVIAYGVWMATTPSSTAAAARVKQLRARREKLFADLVKLERQRRSGHVGASRYADRRAMLVTQLERVYGELDVRGAVGGAGLAA